MTGRVLIVDDEQNIRRRLRAVLEEQGHEHEDIGQMHPAMVGIVHDDCIPISERWPDGGTGQDHRRAPRPPATGQGASPHA